MNCPKCGKEIKDDQLYCEVCGHEVRIVPDFEPEIEMQITETLNSLAEELEQKEEIEKDTEVFGGEQMNLRRGWFKRLRDSEHFSSLLTTAAVLFIVLSIFAGISTYQHNSYNYQITQALAYGDQEEYEKAIPFMERALKISSEDKGAELLLVDYYYKSGEKDNAVTILMEYIAFGEDTLDGYRKLIAIYEEDKKYEEINELLQNCKDAEVLTQFQQYVAYPPQFSLDEGTYYEITPLKLSANAKGTIYYTLDGSRPNKGSAEYTAPIFLDIGSYIVRAVFINSFGIISEQAERRFTIDIKVPYPPEINLYSGIYNTPQLIKAEGTEEGIIYYTMDGTDPTQDSLRYMGGINMPLGESSFKFVTYNKEGAAGEITERKYSFAIKDAVLLTQDAINQTTLFLFQMGYLLDVEGHAANVSGNYIYTCNTAVQLGGQIYYLVIESYIDAMGTQTKTGNQFGVGAMDGIVYKAEQNALGEYVIRTF